MVKAEDALTFKVTEPLRWQKERSGKCELCGEPMPKGEEVFNFHGYSGPCPKPPLPKPAPESVVEPSEERITAAAILQDGVVYTGAHHHQIIRYMVPLLKIKTATGEQGFVTSRGRYVTRAMAARIAAVSGQIAEPQTTLMSEQLWSVADEVDGVYQRGYSEGKRDGARERAKDCDAEPCVDGPRSCAVYLRALDPEKASGK